MTEASSWGVQILRAQGMPAEEIEAVLAADDPAQVRRRLELHAERLQERLIEQLRALSRLERLLMAGAEREPAGWAVPTLSSSGRR